MDYFNNCNFSKHE